MYLHYGCGISVGGSWYNCDGSPTLRLQRLPFIGKVFCNALSPRFPDEVHYGDIVAGIPIKTGSCDAIFCSHVLEHLTLVDLRKALTNTCKYLRPGGAFRLIVPDFELLVKAYQSNPNPEAISNFMTYTSLGRRSRPRGATAIAREIFNNSHHLWMWDFKGLKMELENAGFVNIRRYGFGESHRLPFAEVENQERFDDALAIECSRE